MMALKSIAAILNLRNRGYAQRRVSIRTAFLERCVADNTLPPDTRQAAADSARVSEAVRRVRTETQTLTAVGTALGLHLLATPPRAPKIVVDDCRHTQTLPGAAVAGASQAKDVTAKRTYAQTTALAK